MRERTAAEQTQAAGRAASEPTAAAEVREIPLASFLAEDFAAMHLPPQARHASDHDGVRHS